MYNLKIQVSILYYYVKGDHNLKNKIKKCENYVKVIQI
jgi:hypothetical protein